MPDLERLNAGRLVECGDSPRFFPAPLNGFRNFVGIPVSIEHGFHFPAHVGVPVVCPQIAQLLWVVDHVKKLGMFIAVVIDIFPIPFAHHSRNVSIHGGGELRNNRAAQRG